MFRAEVGVPGVRWQCTDPVVARLPRTDVAGAPERGWGGCLLEKLRVVSAVYLFALPLTGLTTPLAALMGISVFGRGLIDQKSKKQTTTKLSQNEQKRNIEKAEVESEM